MEFNIKRFKEDKDMIDFFVIYYKVKVEMVGMKES